MPQWTIIGKPPPPHASFEAQRQPVVSSVELGCDEGRRAAFTQGASER
jgi:hypothetical protein